MIQPDPESCLLAIQYLRDSKKHNLYHTNYSEDYILMFSRKQKEPRLTLLPLEWSEIFPR